MIRSFDYMCSNSILPKATKNSLFMSIYGISVWRQFYHRSNSTICLLFREKKFCFHFLKHNAGILSVVLVLPAFWIKPICLKCQHEIRLKTFIALHFHLYTVDLICRRLVFFSLHAYRTYIQCCLYHYTWCFWFCICKGKLATLNMWKIKVFGVNESESHRFRHFQAFACRPPFENYALHKRLQVASGISFMYYTHSECLPNNICSACILNVEIIILWKFGCAIR